MSAVSGLEGRAAELRRAFDLSFAAPPTQASRELEDLLLVRIAGEPYAIRLRDVTGIIAKRAVVTVPAAAPGLLGLAGIRGNIVPVFGLASLLGYESATEAPPWFVLCGGEEPVALAFSELDGYVRLARAALHTDEGRSATHKYVSVIATTVSGARPVIAVPLVVETIRSRLGQQRSGGEQ